MKGIQAKGVRQEGMMIEIPLRELVWQDMASCKNMDSKIFFPDYELAEGASRGANGYMTARAICAECIVIQQCLDYACRVSPKSDDRHGMWGGMTPNERGKYIRMTRHHRTKAA